MQIHFTKSRRVAVTWLLAVVIGAFALFVATSQGSAVGTTEVYRVRPAQSGTLNQYGMHFNDSAGTYHMARDWAIGSGGAVDLRVYLQDNMASGTRFKLTHLTDCGVLAQAGYLDGSSVWHAYTGEKVYFTHLSNRVANDTITSAMTSVGTLYSTYVGGSSTCGTSQAHVHESADIGPTTPLYRYIQYGPTETCWSDSTNSSQCPSSYNRDTGVGSCPPASYSGTASVSGNIERYKCETWSAVNWTYDAPLVVAKW